MATKIQLRRDTSANWTSTNPTLFSGEIGFETNTGKFKIGNGSSVWSALDYFLDSSDLSAYLTIASASTTYATKSSPTFTGTVLIGDSSVSTAAQAIEIGYARTGDGASHIDFHTDAVTSDYGTRLIRNAGANGDTFLTHKGTGGLSIVAQNNAPISFATSNTTRLAIDATGTSTFTNNIQLGTSATLIFEGATSNAFDTTLTVVDPTANRTITFPNSTGTVALTSDLTSYVTLTGTQTLSNKTFTSPIINSPTISSTASWTSFNTYVGSSAGGPGISIEGTAIGYQALSSQSGDVVENQIDGGYRNTAVGHAAGNSITLGYNNLVLGYDADVATPTTANTVVLGNSAITDLRCQDTTITAVSDARDKTDIQDIPVGLNFINEIRPVNFEWNMRDEGQVGNRQAGFIAQEVLAVEEKYDTRNWLKAVNTDNPDQLALAPARLLPVMVKAIQELSQQIEALTIRISELESV